MHRRTFLTLLGAGTSAAMTETLGRARWMPVARAFESRLDATPAQLAADEDFWRTIREAYVTDPALIDLDNANVAPAPRPVAEAFIRRIESLRRVPSAGLPDMYADESDARVRPRLAQLLGTKPDELGLLRNTTEAMNTIIRGFPMARGEEILFTSHEFPDMVEMLHRRAKRDGVVVRMVKAADPSEDPKVLIKRLDAAATAKTRLLLISHVSAWSGDILPVRDVCEWARGRGIATIVDAAQSAGILDVSFKEIGADFMAASLHKWLAAPIGTGVLAMRAEWQDRVEPLTATAIKFPNSMGRFEWCGTALEAGWASAGEAIDFQERIGLARKRARIGALGAYWQERLGTVKGVRILTPSGPGRSFGVAAFALDAVPSDKLAQHLRVANGIQVQDKAGPHSPFPNAIRVSPGVYTNRGELDKFIGAVSAVAERGLPATK